MSSGGRKSMKKQEAYQSFAYHGERIYSPLGNKNLYHERMRLAWAFAYDTGLYKRLPNDPIKADEAIERMLDEGKINIG